MDGTEYVGFLKNDTSKVLVKFYDKKIKSDKMQESGIPEFKDELRCRMKFVNSRDWIDSVATDEKINLYRVEYQRYLSEKKQTESGTPLEQFAFLSIAEIETLKAYGVCSVEVLAKLTVEQADNINMLRERNAAVKFLEMNKNNVAAFDITKYESQLAAKDEIIKQEKEKYEAIIISLENEKAKRDAIIEEKETEISKLIKERDEALEVATQDKEPVLTGNTVASEAPKKGK